MSKNGLHLITPTSIVSTGTGNSSSISANGSVTFSSCATLSLNGVFSADYDNYMVVFRHTNTTNTDGYTRLRASGVDSTSGYTRQFLWAGSTSTGQDRSSDVWWPNWLAQQPQSLNVVRLYGPYLAQPTALRDTATNYFNGSDIIIFDTAGTHSASVSYDGFTIYPATGATSGRIAVYGLRK